MGTSDLGQCQNTMQGDRLDNAKFHVESSMLLVISPQVMPDPQGYWEQGEMNERRKCNYHSVH